MLTCDLCKRPDLREYFDARMTTGQWGNLCRVCFRSYGIGLGEGKGQHFLLVGTEYVLMKPSDAPVSNVCTICGYFRNSRLCSCVRRAPTNADPLHFAVSDLADEIRDSRVYTRAMHEQTLLKLGETLHEWRNRLLAKRCDGFSFMRVERDAHRVAKLGEGRIFANAMKWQELSPAERRERTEKQAASKQTTREDALAKLRALRKPQP